MIAIIDYGAGNIASVKKAFDHLQARCVVTSDPAEVRAAEKIVLPGVGHFAATEFLNRSGLRDAIAESIGRSVPFLGICVGMQWLLTGSEEAPGIPGLSLWREECIRFSSAVKSPHVGWNSLDIFKPGSGLLRGVDPDSFVYFTHSYRVPPLQDTIAECEYGGRFSAAMERANVFGVQFHPEKSGAVGLRILKNFCAC